MKVQEIIYKSRRSYILINDDYFVIDSVYKFSKYLLSIHLSPNTIKAYINSLKKYYEFLKISNFDEQTILLNNPISFLSNYRIYIENANVCRPLSDTSINYHIVIVLRFYRFMIFDNIIDNENLRTILISGNIKDNFSDKYNDKLIISSMLKRKSLSKGIEYISQNEFSEIVKYCNQKRDVIIFSLMFMAGFRVGDVLGLHFSDLDKLHENIIRIKFRDNNINNARVKNKSEAEMPIPSELSKMIFEYIIETENENNSEYLFINLNGPNIGKPIKSITINKLCDRISKNVGFHFHPHMFRHGTATTMIENDVPIELVQRILRHKNLTTTQKYQHLSPKILGRKLIKAQRNLYKDDDSNNQ